MARRQGPTLGCILIVQTPERRKQIVFHQVTGLLLVPLYLIFGESRLINIVLLPMQRGIRLNDDALARDLFEFFDQRGLARLEGFGDFGIDAQREALGVEVGGHFSRFGRDFVADRGNGFDHARAGAVRARLAQDALEGLLGALARDADEAELVEREGL